MAVKKPDAVPEYNPPAGGSYTRDPGTGELVKTEGTERKANVPLRTGGFETRPYPAGDGTNVKSTL